MKIGYEHIYDSYRELVIHSENISRSRFQNLLIIKTEQPLQADAAPAPPNFQR